MMMFVKPIVTWTKARINRLDRIIIPWSWTQFLSLHDLIGKNLIDFISYFYMTWSSLSCKVHYVDSCETPQCK